MPDCDEKWLHVTLCQKNQGTSIPSDVISLAHKHHEY